jgi:hypothetical protein
LNLSHYITSDKGYLISWDKYLIDTPILDIINLYKNEYYNTNFEPLLKRYLDIFPLNEDELKLLFITISLPYEINFNNKELYNTTEVSKLLDYIYKTEQLLFLLKEQIYSI